MADRLTGKASYFNLNGVLIPFTKYSVRTTKKLADATDNLDYNSTVDLIGPTQLPVNAVLNVTVEGRFRLSTTPSGIMSILYTGATAIPCTFGLNSGALYGHGLFDFSDFSCDVPIDDIVSFTCSLQSNGIFTPNS